MTEIRKNEFELLLKKGIIKNTASGITNPNGNKIGFYRSVYKRYIEDKYADCIREPEES